MVPPGSSERHSGGLYRVTPSGTREEWAEVGSIETLTETSYNYTILAAVQNRKALVPCLPR